MTIEKAVEIYKWIPTQIPTEIPIEKDNEMIPFLWIWKASRDAGAIILFKPLIYESSSKTHTVRDETTFFFAHDDELTDKMLQYSPKNHYLCNKISEMSISNWIENREMKGLPTFSYKEVCASFPALSARVVSNELYRLGKLKRIQSVHKGFYTIVPIQFKDRGIVPPYNYIGQLMSYLGKPYYISLLSAGVLHGAAHQRPQRMSVMTEPPRITFSSKNNDGLFWAYRTMVPQNLLCQTNSDTGVILYSNAELTAVDLVQYSHLIGGLSVAATVIEELSEKTDFSKNGEELLKCTTFPTLQRLGYIMENILENQEQAESIGHLLQPYFNKLKYRPLASDKPTDNMERLPKWKIIINQDIEPDEW